MITTLFTQCCRLASVISPNFCKPMYYGTHTLLNRLIVSHCDSHFNPAADCGAPPPPVNGSLLQPDTNTTEGSVVVFQCDPGFVPEGVMTAVCGSDAQWSPNPGGVTCSPRPTPTFMQTFSWASIPTQTSTPTGPGENEHFHM